MRTIGNPYMSWFCNEPKKTLEEICKEGCDRYFEKYGKHPKHIHLNKDYGEGKITDEKVLDCEIHYSKTTGKNIFDFSVESSVEPLEEKNDAFIVTKETEEKKKSKFMVRKEEREND